MKRPVPLLLLLLAVALLSGCVRSHERLVLHPDGSGVYELRHALHLSFADEQWRERFHPERLEVTRGSGLRLLQREESVSGTWRELRLAVAFDDLSALARWPALAERHLALTPREREGWLLQFNYPRRPGRSEPLSEEGRGLVGGLLAGFEVESVVELPGVVIKSNGDEVSGRAVRWRYAVAHDPEELDRLEAEEPHFVLFRPDRPGLGAVDEARPVRPAAAAVNLAKLLAARGIPFERGGTPDSLILRFPSAFGPPHRASLHFLERVPLRGIDRIQLSARFPLTRRPNDAIDAYVKEWESNNDDRPCLTLLGEEELLVEWSYPVDLGFAPGEFERHLYRPFGAALERILREAGAPR